jgi:hypothetical protein
MLADIGHWRRRDQSLQLAKCDKRSGERNRADEGTNEHFGHEDASECPLMGVVQVDANCHQYRCQSDETMQHRDQLRHSCHLNAKRHHNTNDGTYDNGWNNKRVGLDVWMQQGGDNR